MFDSLCNALYPGSWKRVLKWAKFTIHTIGSLKGLERRSWNELILFLFSTCQLGSWKELVLSFFRECCHGWWSWNELDLLQCQSFLLYVCSVWHLGSWKEPVLVLSFMFWPVMDWGLERGSWNDLLLLFLLLLGSELLLFASFCIDVFPSTWWTWDKLLVWFVSILDTVLAWFLHSTCMRPNLTLAGCPMMISFRVGVSTTKNWWSWNESFA